MMTYFLFALGGVVLGYLLGRAAGFDQGYEVGWDSSWAFNREMRKPLAIRQVTMRKAEGGDR